MSDNVAEMLEDQAAEHVLTKDQKLLETRGQKVAKTAAALLKKKIGKEVAERIEAAFKRE